MTNSSAPDILHNSDKLRDALFQWWGEDVAGIRTLKSLYIYYVPTTDGEYFDWIISHRPPKVLHRECFDIGSDLISKIFSLWCTEDINTFDPLTHIRPILIVKNFAGGAIADGGYNHELKQVIPLPIIEQLLNKMEPFNAKICFTDFVGHAYRVYLHGQLWCIISPERNILYKINKEHVMKLNKYSPSRKIQGAIKRVFNV